MIEKEDKIKTIVVENNGIENTYLDEHLKDFNCDIVYTKNNSYNCTHKGNNELLDIKHIIQKYDIKDDDIVIKLTGRYKILTNSFFNLIMNNCDNYDAFVKFFNVCTKEFMFGDCVLGLFAIKCKYLKDFNYHNKTGPEWDFADYVRKNINEDKLIEIQNLDLECCFADDLRILIV